MVSYIAAIDTDSFDSARLSPASKRYQAALLSRSDMFTGFEDIDEDDDFGEEFLCPFCSEYFDIVGLSYHLDEEHPIEGKNGVCPVCPLRAGVDMVAHITPQHESIFKMHGKRKLRKGGLYSALSLLRKELREGNLKSLFGSHPQFLTETRPAKESSDEIVSRANLETSTLSVKDKKEKAERCEFVQGLLLGSILDNNL